MADDDEPIFSRGDEQLVKALALILDAICERTPELRGHLTGALSQYAGMSGDSMAGVRRVLAFIAAQLRGDDPPPTGLLH